MALGGDVGSIRAAAAKLKELADKATVRKLSEALAAKSIDLLHAEFQAGTDPYGNTWTPLVTGQPSHLYRTGNLWASIMARDITASGFRDFIGAYYGNFLNNGTSGHLKARPILPKTGEVPQSWLPALTAVTNAIVQPYLELQ